MKPSAKGLKRRRFHWQVLAAWSHKRSGLPGLKVGRHGIAFEDVKNSSSGSSERRLQL